MPICCICGICLHVDDSGVNVGEYKMHGSCGMCGFDIHAHWEFDKDMIFMIPYTYKVLIYRDFKWCSEDWYLFFPLSLSLSLALFPAPSDEFLSQGIWAHVPPLSSSLKISSMDWEYLSQWVSHSPWLWRVAIWGMIQVWPSLPKWAKWSWEMPSAPARQSPEAAPISWSSLDCNVANVDKQLVINNLSNYIQ